MARVAFVVADRDTDTRQFSGVTHTVTAGNYAATVTEVAAFQTALDDVITGTVHYNGLTASEFQLDPISYPTAMLAQVDIEMVVEYKSATTNKIHRMKIPTADIGTDALWQAGGISRDPSHADWIAFDAAFEALFRDPEDGTSAVTVVDVFYKED